MEWDETERTRDNRAKDSLDVSRCPNDFPLTNPLTPCALCFAPWAGGGGGGEEELDAGGVAAPEPRAPAPNRPNAPDTFALERKADDFD